ncbi:nucleotide sugar dehydrogenase [Hydrogenibacillus sp. N12]|uniref:nucleotide sugar dehydrogenase n=1 Tax=Hydrogenibacillus sp. N12 TaxID=2866627 RepID=UPI001C7CB913|nr:nucleotide sugar dehydrogenase [Hydrogenibacillus sp. N12]QZA32417.1 nucleotide sugar dehydrogenase [Hydrogenibacillus sp. N12]
MERPLKVAVIGLGYVGLPLALLYAKNGARVIGIDVASSLVEALNRGESRSIEKDGDRPLPDLLQEMLALGRFRATTDYEEARAAGVDHYIVTVGIPVRGGEPDLRPFEASARMLGRVLKAGDLVLVRSTVVPGATEEVFRPILEAESGLVAGEDFDLAYSSERIAEGRAFEEFRTMPLAVGALGERGLERAIRLLRFVTEAEIYPSSIKVVETAKLFENIQRDVNLAMVQEFARFTERLGIDTLETIRIANTHRRVNLLIPGPGVGGYCVPNAFHYLRPKAEALGVRLPLLALARQLNDGVPRVLVDWVEEELRTRGGGFSGRTVAVLGLAMKDYSNDDRESPALAIADLIAARGAVVRAYDPLVEAPAMYRVGSWTEAVDGADVVFFLVKQRAFDALDWADVGRRMKADGLIFDAKGVVPKDHRPQTVLRL